MQSFGACGARVQLTFTFPEDATTSTGAPFWSAPKRFPHPITFDPSDPAHAAFVQAASILRAEIYGIPRPDYASDAAKVGSCVKVCRPACSGSSYCALAYKVAGGHDAG
eukprot:1085257-Pelagomonas_calceolata.AAC.2